MTFTIYIIGVLIFISGLVYGCLLLHVPPHWIAVSGVLLFGLGIFTGIKATRQKDRA